MSDTPRVLRPNREQLELRPTDLESLLPEDHRARAVWDFVSGLDLSAWYETIRSVEGEAGRPAIDPAIVLSLWIYATLEGVGSARAVARLCEQHDAYRWMCGGVSVSYRTLAAFRVTHAEKLDGLLTESVVQLMEAGLVQLDRMAQDGMRVRASAGAASFRRRTRLRQLEREVEKRIAALRRELEEDPAATSRRVQAARERAARDRRSRVRKALERLREREEEKKPSEREGVRVSTTDPEARVMKMADGGFRPAYNVQLATDVGSQVVIGVEVSDAGSDMHQLVPMLEQLNRRYGDTPREVLVDGGYTSLGAIESTEARGCRVYAPPMQPRNMERNPYRPLPEDRDEVARWRRRMGTGSAQEKYKDRAATAECVNAQSRNRGLWQFGVRGRLKVRCVALLHALAHNVLRSVALKRAWAEAPS
jgi:transposase